MCICPAAIIHLVKLARPPLVHPPKGRTGGTSGLHRTAQEVTPLHRKVRIRATETSRLSSGETGNLYAQQHQVGTRRVVWFATVRDPGPPGGVRVGGIEPGGRPPAQSNGGHAAGNRCAQNPAYRRASQLMLQNRLRAVFLFSLGSGGEAGDGRDSSCCGGTQKSSPRPSPATPPA